MFDKLAARKKMFQEMGEFAGEESANQMRAKYAPPPPGDSEEVPGAEEEDGLEMASEEEPAEDVEAILAQLTPEQLHALLAEDEEATTL